MFKHAIAPEKAARITFLISYDFGLDRSNHLPTGLSRSFIIISLTFEHHTIHH
jgi:hypothetical protein